MKRPLLAHPRARPHWGAFRMGFRQNQRAAQKQNRENNPMHRKDVSEIPELFLSLF
jgi:hypothetical protein